MTTAIRGVLLALLLLAASAPSAPPRRRRDYPSRPVTFVVPFAPGGVTSLFARLLGQKLEQRFGKPFVVENRPGGGGSYCGSGGRPCAARRLHHHDGVEHDPRRQRQHAQEPAVRSAQGPPADLAVGAGAVRAAGQSGAAGASSSTTSSGSPRTNPAAVSFGTPGPGTFHHLNAEMFKGIFGLNLVHVPYKGSAPALSDLAGGSYPDDVLRPAARLAADPERQAARARRHDGAARAGGARYPAVGRGRHSWLRHARRGIPSRRPRTYRSRSSTSSPATSARS